jgi:steroid delta-isomerase-like uncharacterized protein
MKKLFLFAGLAGMLSSCANMENNGSNDQESKNKERVNQFYTQVINAHNVNMIDSFCHADFVDHNPSPGHSGTGADDLKAQFAELFTAFPDINITPDFMVADGDTVVAYVTFTGTQSGPLGPMPASNKKVNIKGIDIVAIKDGKATHRWGFGDDMGMMTQLGMMPGPGANADSTHMPAAGGDTTKRP